MLGSEYPHTPTEAPSTPPQAASGPPPCNDGGLGTPTPHNLTGKFDWYAATVQEDPERLSALIGFWFDAERRTTRGLHGYRAGYEFVTRGSVVARMLYGGQNGDPHVWASGDDTERLVAGLRRQYPRSHRVTRADVALDYDGEGTWDALYGVCRSLAADRRIRQSIAGDWLSDPNDPERGGRTLYLGSKQSAVLGRLYEKGYQLLDQLPPGASTEGISRNAVRLELRVRPEKETRLFAAAAEPVALFGMAAWGQELLERLTELAVERVHIKQRRDSDRDRALMWMVGQYGSHLEDLAGELGSWADVSGVLRSIWTRIQADRSGQ